MRDGQENYARRSKQPVPFPRTVRNPFRAINTSSRAGRVMPGGFIPLMPQDQVKSGSYAQVMVQMEETEKMLSNAVILKAHAFFVSFASLDRFDGLDSVAFGWAGREGAPVIVQNHTYVPATHDPFYRAFGEHIASGEAVNDLYLEAYNQVVNYRREMVSKSLPLRDVLQADLARSLWGNTALARIVPDWDAAMMEQSISLDFIGSELPISSKTFPLDNIRVSGNSMGGTENYTGGVGGDNPTPAVTPRALAGNESTGLPPSVTVHDLFAELSGSAGTVTLAKINQAQKLKTFAEMRARMAGTPDDLIDLLMRGISIPKAAFHDPILIGTATTTIGQMQRYATDAANLDQYVANGAGSLRIPLAMPEQETGGVIVITYEIIPEPVFDRQADMFLRMSFDDLPNAVRDYLDTQPVDVVPNRFVDALHGTPNGTFGYAPMNYAWSQRRIGMGGRYMRLAASDMDDEDQQHVWSVRSVNPVLDEDAFLVPSNLAHNVFQDTIADPFIVRVEWEAMIDGITQFGPPLFESTGDYDAVVGYAPTDAIIPPSAE